MVRTTQRFAGALSVPPQRSYLRLVIRSPAPLAGPDQRNPPRPRCFPPGTFLFRFLSLLGLVPAKRRGELVGEALSKSLLSLKYSLILADNQTGLPWSALILRGFAGDKICLKQQM